MNAIPVFAEIDESLNIDPADIEKKITSKTKAIIAVHMLGNPCDMDSIMKIAKKYNLYVIEDCCQACGASYKGKYVGTYGDISAFSFNFYKVITAGDGGAVITNDEKLYIRAFAFHDQGHNPYRIGQEIGYRTIVGCNFRMNELSGAVMLAQLRKLDNLLNTLREKKKRLKEQLKSSGIKFRVINDENGECATLLTLLFDSAANAEKFCTKIGASVIASSGWHVYNNMEHILSKRVYGTNECPYNCHYYGKDVKYSRNMLPKTDDILSRAVNISVGVVDKGLGANFGIDITTDNAGIDSCAQKILTFLKQI
jgi:8-amino-3,8-dideoxy-alpha-D-manno-octulosonate transaminase